MARRRRGRRPAG